MTTSSDSDSEPSNQPTSNPTPDNKNNTPSQDPQLENRFSAGEDILINADSDNTTFLEHKQQGVQAFASSNYNQAVQQFQAALQEKRNSPETLIYLNNAEIGAESAFKVAVTVPVGSDTVLFALEMLRGYAQAQEEINAAGGINGKPLQLVIADDDDNPKVATQVAQELANQQDILAVSGHWSSSTTLAVAPIYDKNELVLVNPVSTSTQISGASDYVFRTIPSNFIVGATMANYALNDLQAQQVAIFYDSDSGYSLSLRRELKTSLSTRGGTAVAEFDLSAGGFLAQQRLNEAQQQGAEAIVLIPSPKTIDRALQVVNVNNGNLPLIGDIGNLYGVKTLQVGGEDAVGMAIPIPWHIQKPGSQTFVQKSRQLWGGDVNWATVMAYDAMNAIAQAIEQNPSREGLQNALSSSGFSAPGVIQPIKFLPSGDRDGRLIMVEVQPANPSRSGTGYDFVPVN
ncbi:ABC transporter substrate-binding protein [Halothece sp. PCC 7418]|uniref:ABC transporter substrate-binding protein n=1 Tax=Halothece sp. (strain PCC 7418) TaxID=65093 RepID=UPI000310375C|nr:ABC transporter substrate-binding protein [Halothece sp. PCC 7418]